jgi:hypothetical protein
VKSTVGSGTEVRIRLPIAQDSSQGIVALGGTQVAGRGETTRLP